MAQRSSPPEPSPSPGPSMGPPSRCSVTCGRGSPGAVNRSTTGGRHPPRIFLPVAVHRLTKTQARRIAVRAQLLDARRPPDQLGVVTHLTFLQLDPTAAIAPSADLVAWTRLGV